MTILPIQHATSSSTTTFTDAIKANAVQAAVTGTGTLATGIGNISNSMLIMKHLIMRIS